MLLRATTFCDLFSYYFVYSVLFFFFRQAPLSVSFTGVLPCFSLSTDDGALERAWHIFVVSFALLLLLAHFSHNVYTFDFYLLKADQINSHNGGEEISKHFLIGFGCSSEKKPERVRENGGTKRRTNDDCWLLSWRVICCGRRRQRKKLKEKERQRGNLISFRLHSNINSELFTCFYAAVDAHSHVKQFDGFSTLRGGVRRGRNCSKDTVKSS